jgi:hypothetical protein
MAASAEPQVLIRKILQSPPAFPAARDTKDSAPDSPRAMLAAEEHSPQANLYYLCLHLDEAAAAAAASAHLQLDCTIVISPHPPKQTQNPQQKHPRPPACRVANATQIRKVLTEDTEQTEIPTFSIFSLCSLCPL